MTLSELVDGDEFFFEPGLCLLLLLVEVAADLLLLHLLGLLLRTGRHKLRDLGWWHFRMFALSYGEIVSVIGVERAADDRLVVHRGIGSRDLRVSLKQFLIIVDGCFWPIAHKRSQFIASMDLGLI